MNAMRLTLWLALAVAGAGCSSQNSTSEQPKHPAQPPAATASAPQSPAATPLRPPVATVEDLSGQEVFVRKTSSYYESLQELNRRLHAQGKPRWVEMFKEYGERYKFDYLMMAAQGSQESRLDQEAKSHVGASMLHARTALARPS
jgi:hypothetical protein